MYTHEINEIPFIIEQDIEGWFWTNAWSESDGFFPVQSEAIADAILWVRERADHEADEHEAEEEASRYGSYEDQVRTEFRAGIRLPGAA